MNKFPLILMTTAALLSLPPAMAGQAADCDKVPVTRADAIADAIDHQGHASPTLIFQRGTAKLAPASRAQLAELATLLDDERDLHIQVGFAAEGATLPELANDRARAVREALLELRAPADRVAVREVKTEAEIAKVEVADGPQHCAVPAAGAAGS